jgi:transposase InsO family protein
VIEELGQKVPIDFLCKHFGACRSGYYKWKKQREVYRLTEKEIICRAIKNIFKDSKNTYGSPRVWAELKSKGFKISENTVAKYMKELGLDARHRKSFKVQTTDSGHEDPIAPRVFKTEEVSTHPKGPGEVLAGDITYLRLGTKNFLYLAVVLDLFNREVVGWSMGNSLETSLVLTALKNAMNKVGPDAEVTFHSDRGSQYASEAYRNFLKDKNMIPSMSRKGNCYDNAYVESWFASLKKEWIYRRNYSSEKELKALVFEYIETWYNRKRKHSALDYMSPEEYKNNHRSA